MNNEKKNALIIAYNDLNNSGVPNVIYQTIKALYNDYNFDVVVFGDNNLYFDRLKKEGVDNINIFRYQDNAPKNKLTRIFWHLFSRSKGQYKFTLKLVKDKKYEVVHSFKERDSWPFFKAAKKRNISKRIMHSTVILDDKGKFLLRNFNKKNKRLSLKYASDYIGVSDSCCKIAFGKKPYTVIYNGYDEEVFNEKMVNKLENNELVLTHFSTFNSNKNQLFSIEVLIALKNIYGEAKLKLVGKETEEGYLKKMYSYINEKSLSSDVEIIDGSQGIKDNFNYTTFTLLPSGKEGAGITAIESQACGIKVFASTSVSKEMNAGGVIYLDVNDGASAWAKRIFEEYQRIGNTRQKFDLGQFSKASFKNSILKIYQNN